MKLSRLLKNIRYELFGVDRECEISFPVSDSRAAGKNSLFFCIDGTKRSGRDHVQEAFSRGAAACVSEKTVAGCPCVKVENVREAAAHIWNNYYGDPARDMRLFGITGTNGKTSTARFLKSILDASGRKTGLIGTEGIFAGDDEVLLPGGEIPDIPASMTTPDPKTLYGALAIMHERGITDAVIEVSSHSIYQKKTAALDFFCGVFTNLSPEHLDLHGNMEEYFRVKKSFLDKCRIIVYNRDDKYGARFYPMGHSYGITDAESIVLTEEKTEYYLRDVNGKIRISAEAAGDFTVYNTMAASTCALAAGIMPQYIEKGIREARPVPGRMETVLSPEEYGFRAVIDFAHTPAALEASLKSIKKDKCRKTYGALRMRR